MNFKFYFKNLNPLFPAYYLRFISQNYDSTNMHVEGEKLRDQYHAKEKL